MQGVSAETNKQIFKEFEGKIWKDDQLGLGEIDLICGTYHKIESEPGPCAHKQRIRNEITVMSTESGGRCALLSWWPRQNIWNGSGMNIGCWTDGNEAWFTERLARIRDGTAKPMTSAEWRRRLKKDRALQDRFVDRIGAYTHNALFAS